MRILQVRFKNLNSLTGEWCIDFTHPSYVSDGIFAITGPTGAGKTTILDALCLALYGRTPRLERVVKSGNEIMSRQTGECFAEVTFETKQGRFRCHWSQHRARKTADGELQAPRHEISDADSGQVVEAKLRDVAGHIEKVTGMDFERFTRSMLLAQGGFAAFLQASPDERAPILEQITGTEIYSQISMQVHKRQVEEHNKLSILQTDLNGLQVLSEEQEQELSSLLVEKRDLERELTARCETLRQALAWRDGIAKLEKEVAALDSQWRDLDERQKAFGPDRMRLERAGRALAWAGEYQKVLELRRQQLKEVEELAEIRAKLPAREAALTEASEASRAAADYREEVRARQKQEVEVIRQVREMDLLSADKGLQIAAVGESIAKVERQRQECGHLIVNYEEALKKSQVALSETEHYLAGHAVDAGLISDLTAISKMFDTLREKDGQYRRTSEVLAAASAGKEAALIACSKNQVEHEDLTARLEKAERDYRQLTEEIRIVLKEREIEAWRAELDTLKERRRLLEQIWQTQERMAVTGQALEGLKGRQTFLNSEKLRLAGEIKSVTGEKAACAREVVQLETQFALLCRIRDLEGERGRLEDGKLCPLCGAIEHPYAAGNIPVPDEVEKALQSAKGALQAIANRLARLQVSEAETGKDILQARYDAGEKKTAWDADEQGCLAVLAELKMDITSEERLTRIAEELPVLQTSIDAAAAIIKEVELKSKKEKAALESVETIRTSFARSEKSLQQAMHRRETAERDQERLTAECANLAEQSAGACRAVLQELERYGVAEIVADRLDGLLKSLTSRRDTWHAKQEEKAGHEKKSANLRTEKEKQQLLLGRLDADGQAKFQAQTELIRQSDALSKSRSDLYGRKSTDEEEKLLRQVVENAEKAWEQARADQDRWQHEVGNLLAGIARLCDSTGQRATERLPAEQTLAGHLTKAGFADESDYQAACLPAEQWDSLTSMSELLRRELTELAARRQDKTTALRTEREKLVYDQPRDNLQQELNACESGRKETQEEIGAVSQRLKENETRLARQRERMECIASQQKECLRWEALHQLIGSADGKKYRNFAQGLTFEMMTAQANCQLRKMSDRYLLVRDDIEPLELNVIDNYQAGEIRSTKNLSGGESFIVSLAMALGLSQMASRNERVDSLFLDEGFGSLDDDALEMALETLAGLHQEGKLIGVISHVPALKERIRTQIQVIPQAGGRSSISGPGCGSPH